MSLQLHISCSNHQKDDCPYGREEQIWISTISDAEAKSVKRHLERRGWVVQFNGDNMDTYCSKECAK